MFDKSADKPIIDMLDKMGQKTSSDLTACSLRRDMTALETVCAGETLQLTEVSALDSLCYSEQKVI